MSILFAMALAAANPATQPAPAATADHSQHAQHQQHMEHMKQCHDMMAKMHQGMKHDGQAQPGDAKTSAEHKGHSAH